jgi:hypothetical protein
MSEEAELKFLKPWVEEARIGEVMIVPQIRLPLEDRLGPLLPHLGYMGSRSNQNGIKIPIHRKE